MKNRTVKIFIILIAAVCAVSLAVGVYRKLDGYKKQHDKDKYVLAVQDKVIKQLEAQRDKLKAQLAGRVSVSAPAQVGESKPNNPVQEVLDPTPEGASDKQTEIDALKKRYEDVLVTYFLLKKCQKANPADYHVIISALSQEMASLNAPGRLQYDVLTSAQGTYNELYAGGACDAKTIDSLYGQYKTYIDAVGSQFMPR